ncbi:E3 ubiquitin-protein ligase RMA1 [Acorus calamus]|uniref:E3 ubiquitin-protein ligase RMA n=1 Tax=Acorus calamus TaxID=4465 RepID=A0AAV9FL83_ACOCL|nr:E3 ubiquitin-protein ligase RMA1 [Acorus calamus]
MVPFDGPQPLPRPASDSVPPPPLRPRLRPLPQLHHRRRRRHQSPAAVGAVSSSSAAAAAGHRRFLSQRRIPLIAAPDRSLHVFLRPRPPERGSAASDHRYSPPYVQYLPSVEQPPPADASILHAPPPHFHNAPPVLGESSDRDLNFRFQRLIETSLRLRQLRFRGSSDVTTGSHNVGAGTDLAAPVQKALEDAALEDEKGETADAAASAGSAADFECNICMDVSREPVVTSCGHLFCWPCLYQWLHVHSDHKECPVCKGEVTESNLTPIFGRGSGAADESGAGKNKGIERDGAPGPKIPPRPRGHRIESWQQQLRRPRPLTRRSGELLNSSRRLRDDLRNQNTNLQRMIEAAGDRRAHPYRWRASARTPQQREGANPDVTRNLRAARETASSSGTADDNSFNDGLRRFVLSMPVAVTGGPSQSRVLVGVDQASASSTVGLIQGGAAGYDASAGPNSGDTSRATRRTRRSGDASSSQMELDELVLHGRRKRRPS